LPSKNKLLQCKNKEGKDFLLEDNHAFNPKLIKKPPRVWIIEQSKMKKNKKGARK